jgi:hypothetical protein
MGTRPADLLEKCPLFLIQPQMVCFQALACAAVKELDSNLVP